MDNLYILPEERKILRALAQKQADYAALPIMEERPMVQAQRSAG